MARRYTDNEIEGIIQAYQSGVSPTDIGKKYSRASASIIMLLQRKGVHQYKVRHWTPEEIAYLKEHYPVSEMDEIMSVLCRDKASIQDKAAQMKIGRIIYGWSDEDIELLIANRAGKSIKDLVLMFDNRFSKTAISTKLHVLGIGEVKLWTDEERAILIHNYECMPMDELVKLLPGRTRKAIITESRKHNLIQYKYFTEQEVEYILKHWQMESDAEIAAVLNRTQRAIKTKRAYLGLARAATYSGGETIASYIHTRNKEWRKASMIACNYKCVLTGEAFDEIHHLYGSNLILDEALRSLGIQPELSMMNYAEEELERIRLKYVEVQEQYPLGVCLTKDIHTLFHIEYGFGSNTPEQFVSFSKKYISGAYAANAS